MTTTIPTLQAMAPGGVAPENAGGMPAVQTNASIPVQLTLQVGTVSMALGQLLEVGVGTVLTDEITSFFPKVKMLAGDRVIAEGDLVQVEGKVGLRISKLLG